MRRAKRKRLARERKLRRWRMEDGKLHSVAWTWRRGVPALWIDGRRVSRNRMRWIARHGLFGPRPDKSHASPLEQTVGA